MTTFSRPIMGICLALLAGLHVVAQAQPAQQFHPGHVWPDDSGKHINAHGGGVLHHDGVYYWYGEHRPQRDQPRELRGSPGVSVYSSTDLYNWKRQGIALAVDDENSNSPIARGCNIERPKVVYNAFTRKFVMWMHLELKGRGYGAALSAIAVADQPTGPFEFVRATRGNVGWWPENLAVEHRRRLENEGDLKWWTPPWREAIENGLFTRRDYMGGQMSRDQTVFVDDDGKAYQIASAEDNLTLHIRELTDDYLGYTGRWLRIFPGEHNEAPAIFKHDGTYYLLCSGATGWDPNNARAFAAPSMWGPWEPIGNPCQGVNTAMNMGPDKTFGGQSTFIFPVQGKPGAFIAMFDQWRPKDLADSRYFWLPLRVGDGKFTVQWKDAWDLSVFDNHKSDRAEIQEAQTETAPVTTIHAPSQEFRPTALWPDDQGTHINAHGGGVLHHDGVYYWFGEHKITNKAEVGVHCYASTDLYNWKDRGVALAVEADSESEIVSGCIIERPKVVYNQSTGKFVMWFHLELKGQGYKAARTGVAVSDSVTGPYKYLGSHRPNPGVWPENMSEEERRIAMENVEETDRNQAIRGGVLVYRDLETGQMARDMTIFVDDDSKAYHIHAAEGNATLHIAELTDDYLGFTGRYRRFFPGGFNEAPAVFKHDGRYYMIASGCTGWDPNPARSFVADSIWGPWKELGNPCVGEPNPSTGMGVDKTFGGQSTHVLPVEGKPGAFIAMFDIWRPKNAIDGRYMWLPVEFEGDRFIIRYREAWDLSVFNP